MEFRVTAVALLLFTVVVLIARRLTEGLDRGLGNAAGRLIVVVTVLILPLVVVAVVAVVAVL